MHTGTTPVILQYSINLSLESTTNTYMMYVIIVWKHDTFRCPEAFNISCRVIHLTCIDGLLFDHQILYIQEHLLEFMVQQYKMSHTSVSLLEYHGTLHSGR